MTPTIELYFGEPVLDPFLIGANPLNFGTVVKQTTTKIVVEDDLGNKVVFTGDLTPGGEVNGFKFKSNGIKVAQGEDFEVDFATFETALGNPKPGNEVLSLLFLEAPIIKGSPYRDVAMGLPGDGLVAKGRDGDDVLIGGEGSQTIKGGKGNDVIGGGGEKDKLFGGKGNDIFLFDIGTGPGGGPKRVLDEDPVLAVHRIKNFDRKDDVILLTGNSLDAETGGPLSKDAFVVDTEATTADHRVIYDDETGSLYLDEDGSGELMAPVKFGKVDPGTKLKARDFFIDDQILT
ncbi:hypothetical protein [Bauldia sp.]|uniref:hypothetical protein n=1 Tax=Bauldia sp. TaxID=2575872 RepID=UPI003BAB2749